MLELPQELLVWMKTGLSVFVLALVYFISIVIVVGVAAMVILRGFIHYRRPQAVVCPTTGETVELRIAPFRAAVGSLFAERDFEIRSCSRGMPLDQCNHACVSQIS